MIKGLVGIRSEIYNSFSPWLNKITSSSLMFITSGMSDADWYHRPKSRVWKYMSKLDSTI